MALGVDDREGWLQIGNESAKKPDPFIGPLDGETVDIAASVRKLISSYSGSCCRLRRDSDDAESDFGFVVDGANRILDTASIATWLGGANGYLVTIYDQSGNGNDFNNPTAASQPQYVSSVIGGRPAFDYVAAASTFVESTITQTQPLYITQVLRINVAKVNARFWGTSGSTTVAGQGAGGGLLLNSGSQIQSAVQVIFDNTDYQISFVVNGASSSIRINNAVDVSGNAGTNISNNLRVAPTGAVAFDGHMAETVQFPATIANSTFETDQLSFFGIS